MDRRRLEREGVLLSAQEIELLADVIAADLFDHMGSITFQLSRLDIGELIEDGLLGVGEEDFRAVVWAVWALIQEGAEIAASYDRRGRGR